MSRGSAIAWLGSSGFLANTLLFALLAALMLLAGHIQTAYINLFGLGVWAICPHLPWSSWRSAGALFADLWPRLSVYVGGVILGVLLCAGQLLPTLELSPLGLRSGGLDYWDATSFSLRPLKLHWTLLPSYGLADLSVIFETLGYTEFVAYMGWIGLVLAGFALWRGRSQGIAFGLLFAALGLFLALGRWNPAYYLLYKLAPGFDLFRAPARWMMLYTLGMAVLAGSGLDLMAARLARARSRTVFAAAVSVLIALEMVVASRALPHTQTTAPQAVYDVRTAPAFLLSDPERGVLGAAGSGRFLSMSTITFDPGDMADLRRILLESDPPQLTESAFDQLIVALKGQEILAPNLPLLWRVPAVDGFDGGVLPLARYLGFLTLFIPEEQLVPDGRLREQVAQMPNARLLNLLNVQYVITDKVRDLWFDGVYYDRQIGAHLSADSPVVEIEVALPFPPPTST
ncbi:MAG: hypothetical protein HC802_10175 [Caldilineaceae bacterium]|nr:hypothetical protein [Caldilineaceae bacterium]